MDACPPSHVHVCQLSCLQVIKKDRTEPRVLSITPSESTHFRVILSSEVMEEESKDGDKTTDSTCSIVRPEPRPYKPTACCREPQPPAASSQSNAKPERKPRWTSSPPSRRDSGSAARGVDTARDRERKGRTLTSFYLLHTPVPLGVNL